MSGGEQQMLAVARALMGSPQLLLLDEPSMGLAPVLVDLIFDTIETIREQGTTVLVVEQNALAALRIADYAYVLESGVPQARGPGSTHGRRTTTSSAPTWVATEFFSPLQARRWRSLASRPPPLRGLGGAVPASCDPSRWVAPQRGLGDPGSFVAGATLRPRGRSASADCPRSRLDARVAAFASLGLRGLSVAGLRAMSAPAPDRDGSPLRMARIFVADG